MSAKVRINYVVDAIIGLAFVVSALSGVILYLVPGGYQGGRNPYYNRTVLFLGHHTWSDLHTWVSFLMVAGVLLHLVLHWNWILSMTKKALHIGERPAAGASCPVPIDPE